MNTQNIPENRGWIIDGRKVHGRGEELPETNAKFIETKAERKILHEYYPRGFILRQMKTGDTDTEGWTKVCRERKLITSHRKTPCRREIHGNGYCDLLNDEEHRKYHYHFSRGNKAEKSGKLPICKYTQGKCWEYNRDPYHKHHFFHYQDIAERTDSEIDYAIDWGESRD